MLILFRTPDEIHRRPELVFLTGDEVRHLRARRLRTGDPLWLADGRGSAHPAVLGLEEGRNGRWWCQPDFSRIERQPLSERIVFSALPKGGRLDVIAEKGTELGMTRFIPVDFERSVRESLSKDRLQRLAEQAASQSGRFRLPIFENPVSFDELVERVLPGRPEGDAGIRFYLLDMAGEASAALLLSSLSRTGSKSAPRESSGPAAALIVGPEGGLTEGEVVALREAGARLIRVADGILRVETAVLAGLTIVQMLQTMQTVE